MENKLIETLSLLLNKKIKIDDDVSMQNCETWDSMKHIEIITTLEDEFDLSFSTEDIPKLTSLNLLKQKIKELL